ncbi:MAG: methyltransferase [Bacteroidota bacterium]|nr:methyltransferase [Bacteroidota bacterium]
MRSALKHIVAHTYKPLLVRYLSKTRVYHYENIRLEIPPQVFHPGFFFSTRLLLNYIRELPLKNKSFLELGCGSGLISLYAQKKGAMVTATDINPTAIEFLRKNSEWNGAAITIILSDLFRDIPVQLFDIVAINPPYYKKKPVSAQDYAWCCGENGEYFEALFGGLGNYVHPGSEVYMVLFDGCDMEMIENLAAQNGFNLNCVLTRKNLLEKNSIYKIEKIN